MDFGNLVDTMSDFIMSGLGAVRPAPNIPRDTGGLSSIALQRDSGPDRSRGFYANVASPTGWSYANGRGADAYARGPQHAYNRLTDGRRYSELWSDMYAPRGSAVSPVSIQPGVSSVPNPRAGFQPADVIPDYGFGNFYNNIYEW